MITKEEQKRVEEIRVKFNWETEGSVTDLLSIIDKLQKESLLQRLMVDRKTNAVILLLDGTQIVYSESVAYNIIPPVGRDMCLETFPELASHLETLLTKERQ